MMILSSLSSKTATPIDPVHWLPSGNFTDPPQWNLDTWARKTVYLLGMVHNLSCRTRHISNDRILEASKREWNELSARIHQHQEVCPPPGRPLSVVEQQPFREIGYTNGSVAAAWQMYHTLVLVHCISAPSFPAERLSTLCSASSTALEHAKLIVANSITNRFDTAWVNAVQLLTTAGQCLVGWQSRHACTTVLDDIRRATGWKTRDNLAILFQSWNQEGSTNVPVCANEHASLLLHLMEAVDQPSIE